MKREIKFRAWIYGLGKMTPVKEIDFDGYMSSVMVEINSERHEQMFFENTDYPDCELMQYTGLKDKNGLEVYFNDVVEDEYGHRYEVVFEGDCLRCNGIRKIRDGHKPKNRWFGIDLEIIGNRFENPKLLEEEE